MLLKERPAESIIKYLEGTSSVYSGSCFGRSQSRLTEVAKIDHKRYINVRVIGESCSDRKLLARHPLGCVDSQMLDCPCISNFPGFLTKLHSTTTAYLSTVEILLLRWAIDLLVPIQARFDQEHSPESTS